MQFNDVFGSKYLKCADLNGNKIQDVVASVDLVEFKDETTGQKQKKMRLHLRDSKPLLLNMTNATTLVQLSSSEDTDKWIGLAITLAPAKTQYGPKLVDCIRIEAAQEAAPMTLKEVLALLHSATTEDHLDTARKQLGKLKPTMTESDTNYFKTVYNQAKKKVEKLLLDGPDPQDDPRGDKYGF